MSLATLPTRSPIAEGDQAIADALMPSVMDAFTNRSSNSFYVSLPGATPGAIVLVMAAVVANFIIDPGDEMTKPFAMAPAQVYADANGPRLLVNLGGPPADPSVYLEADAAADMTAAEPISVTAASQLTNFTGSYALLSCPGASSGTQKILLDYIRSAGWNAQLATPLFGTPRIKMSRI